MFDVKWIRENPEAFDRGRARRNLPPLSAEIVALDAKRRAAQTSWQEMQARRNELSKQIGQLKSKGQDASAVMAEVAGLKDKMAEAEAAEQALAKELEAILASIPNLPADDVPDGLDEKSNREERVVGGKPNFAFQPKQHFEIGEGLGLMNFEAAAKLSGARFVVLKGMLARLERALAQFMLDLHTGRARLHRGLAAVPGARHGAVRHRPAAEIRRGPVPHRAGALADPDRRSAADQPGGRRDPRRGRAALRFTALTPCFRSEAGAAGKDTRGMIRQHQFQKVELVSIAQPDQSDAEHERMTDCAEEVLKRLGLPYRVITLCTGDMGFSAQKTYDIEVWLPGQNAYREISSCSNCGDFQARRMKARCRKAGEKGTRFVHTLNGSGLAVGRTLIAILENYQQQDGTVAIPAALRPYMNGLERIAKANA